MSNIIHENEIINGHNSRIIIKRITINNTNNSTNNTNKSVTMINGQSGASSEDNDDTNDHICETIKIIDNRNNADSSYVFIDKSNYICKSKLKLVKIEDINATNSLLSDNEDYYSHVETKSGDESPSETEAIHRTPAIEQKKSPTVIRTKTKAPTRKSTRLSNKVRTARYVEKNDDDDDDDDDDDEIEIKRPRKTQETDDEETEFYHNDRQLPILSRTNKGLPIHDICSLIIDKNIQNICTKVPTSIEETSCFLVDLHKLKLSKDIYSDCMGVWSNKGSPTSYVRYDRNKYQVVEDRSTANIKVERKYFTHSCDKSISKIVAFITKDNVLYNKCIVQYIFKNGRVAINKLLRPHGNAKSNKIYTRTLESVKTKIAASSNLSKNEIIKEIIQEKGGLSKLNINEMPRNSNQITYIRSKPRNDDDELSMLLNKAKENDCYIKEISLYPDLCVVLFNNQQIIDLERFCCNNAGSVLGIETTFELNNYFVTVLTFRNLLFVNSPTETAPLIIGPALLHQTKTQSAYTTFAYALLKSIPSLRGNVSIVGTRDESLDAFINVFQSVEYDNETEYIQNALGSINSLINRRITSNTLKMHEFCDQYKKIIIEQQEKLRITLFGIGEYKINPKYKSLFVPSNRFNTLTSAEKEEQYKKLETLKPIDFSSNNDTDECNETLNGGKRALYF